jgi:hypothetical protein
MHNALLVGGCKTSRNLYRGLDRLTCWERASAQSVSKRFTFKQLGNNIWRAIVGADVEDCQDIWMI